MQRLPCRHTKRFRQRIIYRIHENVAGNANVRIHQTLQATFGVETLHATSLPIHGRFDFFDGDGDAFEEVDVAGPGEPEIVLNADAHLLFFNVNAGFYSE